jgi:hypothetical protein
MASRRMSARQRTSGAGRAAATPRHATATAARPDGCGLDRPGDSPAGAEPGTPRDIRPWRRTLRLTWPARYPADGQVPPPRRPGRRVVPAQARPRRAGPEAAGPAPAWSARTMTCTASAAARWPCRRPQSVIGIPSPPPPDRIGPHVLDLVISDGAAQIGQFWVRSFCAGTGPGARVLPTVAELTGRPARTFSAWAARCIAAFRQGAHRE